MPEDQEKTIRLEDVSGEVSLEVEVTPEGISIGLELAADREFHTADLELEAVGGQAPAPAVISTVDGAVDGLPSEPVSWVVADFGREYLVSALEIKTSNGGHIRLKGFGGSAWTPLMPVDRFSLSKEKGTFNFSRVSVSRMMVEFIKESTTKGVWEPDAVIVEELKFLVSRLPRDLELFLGDGCVKKHPGVLDAGEGVGIENFSSLANNWLTSHPGVRVVPLKLLSSLDADIIIRLSRVGLIKVVRAFASGDRRTELELAQGGEGRVKIDGLEGREIGEGCFDYEADLSGERMVQDFSGGSPVLAHLCDHFHSAAQGIEPLPDNDRLTGLELYLRPAKTPVAATLSIHPDEGGQPREVPYPGSRMALRIEQQPGHSRWFPFRLSSPCEPDGRRWWAVLAVSEGELHWHLNTFENGPRSGEAMNRIDGYSWQSRAGYRAWMRVMARGESVPEVRFVMARGEQSVHLAPDAGSVELKEEALKVLNQDKAGELELRVRSSGRGRVTISNLKIITDEP